MLRLEFVCLGVRVVIWWVRGMLGSLCVKFWRGFIGGCVFAITGVNWDSGAVKLSGLRSLRARMSDMLVSMGVKCYGACTDWLFP